VQSATTITLENDKASIVGPGAAFSQGLVKITEAGTYELSGTFTGQILVDAAKTDVVRLALKNLNITNPKGSAIYSKKAQKTVLILLEKTENSVTDGTGYTFEAGTDEPNSAIFSKDSLSITGDGKLTVDGKYNMAIESKDVLTITGGEITATSVGDALRGHDGVAISGGIIKIDSGSDGIKSNNSSDSALGYVSISGGAFDIKAANDAVQAETELLVTGGVFQVFTGGGAANAPASGREDFGWQRREPATEAPEEAESDSKKAFKAGTLLSVSGGEFEIDSEDDAFHSNDKLSVSGGVIKAITGDDAFHADKTLLVSGGDSKVEKCYEGLESAYVEVSGGSVDIYATDDAINASSGEQTNQWGRGGADNSLMAKITGGTVNIYGGTDGIDSNGNVNIEGGDITVSSKSQGMEGAIDLDGTLLFLGGNFIAAGSVLSPSQASTQESILLWFSSTKPKGSLFELKDKDGKILLSYESKMDCQASAFSSPAITQGETYSVFIDGEKLVDIEATGISTSVSDTGAPYQGNGWGGGGGGGFRPGRQNPNAGTVPGAGMAPGGNNNPDRPSSNDPRRGQEAPQNPGFPTADPNAPTI
jgi:phage baseplate assembly protein gpV